MKEKAYLNWSGGKDAALALYKIMQSNRFEISTLFTVVNTDTGKVPMHEVSLQLLKRQAESIGVPLTLFNMDVRDSQNRYAHSMKAMIDSFKTKGIDYSIFGDIYLEELKKRR